MPDRFADFDEAFAEQTPEPLIVKLYGKRWVLPGAMPAIVPLKMVRYHADRGPGEALSDEEVAELAAHLVPLEVREAWDRHGMTPERLAPVVTWITTALMAREREPSGEAPAPTASSNGGGSSKPTSPASTASTSPATSDG